MTCNINQPLTCNQLVTLCCFRATACENKQLQERKDCTGCQPPIYLRYYTAVRGSTHICNQRGKSSRFSLQGEGVSTQENAARARKSIARQQHLGALLCEITQSFGECVKPVSEGHGWKNAMHARKSIGFHGQIFMRDILRAWIDYLVRRSSWPGRAQNSHCDLGQMSKAHWHISLEKKRGGSSQLGSSELTDFHWTSTSLPAPSAST